MSAAEFKKQFSENFSSLDLPPPLDHINPETLATLIDGQGQGGQCVLKVVDVRQENEYAKGSVVGATNIVLDDSVETNLGPLGDELAAALKAKKTVHLVFLSLQSPDIDEAAALSFCRMWDERPEVVNRSLPPASSFTSILLGGLLHFFQLFRENGKLVVNYDGDTWEPVLKRTITDEPQDA